MQVTDSESIGRSYESEATAPLPVDIHDTNTPRMSNTARSSPKSFSYYDIDYAHYRNYDVNRQISQLTPDDRVPFHEEQGYSFPSYAQPHQQAYPAPTETSYYYRGSPPPPIETPHPEPVTYYPEPCYSENCPSCPPYQEYNITPDVPAVSPSSHGHHTEQQQWPEDPTDMFTDHDVLCGRGALMAWHPGNKEFRRRVAEQRSAYTFARRRDKPRIAQSILESVYSRGGRFLRETVVVSEDDSNPKERVIWEEVKYDKAYEKTCQALREGAPEIRRQWRLAQSKKKREDDSGR